MKIISAIAIIILTTSTLLAQNPPGLSLIRQEDLKRDLYALADGHFNGRSAGTTDELKGAMWLAEQYKAIGLKPAGDDGTYFQYFNLWRNELSATTSIQINNKPLTLWKDIAVSQMANVSLNAPIVYLGDAATMDTNAIDVKGKVVALVANKKDIILDVSLLTWRYSRYINTKYGLPLLRRGAAAIIFIADDIAEQSWADATENFKRGTYDVDGGPNVTITSAVPVMWVHASAKKELEQNTATIKANLVVAKYSYPSVNVVGIATGTDPKYKSQYLLYSGHTDAHGIRNNINGDSIFYGADDNASVNVAMLACARAFVKYPGKRSVLFVIHGAEERGLFGSRYYSANPTVPINSIVAVLNGDMIGRNNIDSAAILGQIPPHRNSTELVNMALAANKEGPAFMLDTTWDSPSHIEGWYFRSDHLPYARLGIPSLMYTTLLHPDYHTPLDRADKINYAKLKKMTDWMYRTGWKVVSTDKKPAKDANFKLER